MKILKAEQIRAIDALTIQHEPIASIDLMERAARAFTRWFTLTYTQPLRTLVFCGYGNNGGDGLAVARLLTQRGYTVSVYLVPHSKKGSEDFEANLKRLDGLVPCTVLQSKADFPAFQPGDVAIDAIFGTGLSRKVRGLAADLIHYLNQQAPALAAIDIPSGLFADAHNPDTAIVKATHTFSFQFPKLSFFMPQHQDFTGKWSVGDIGLLPRAIAQVETPYHYFQKADAVALRKPRRKFSHKGTYGHVLTIGGSYGKIGAAVLMTRAALRAGCGLVTAYVPRCGYGILQTAVPEAMCLTDEGEEKLVTLPALEGFSAIAVGPGMGTVPASASMLGALFAQAGQPLVIDADALNLVAANAHLKDAIPENSILTPHPKEFARLAGEHDNDFQRIEALRKFCVSYKVVMVLKGAFSAVCNTKGEVWFNSTGNPGMATAGSGDVLTGVIASLLAQGYAPADAARLGVYLHGAAGDAAAAFYSQEALTASDLVGHLGKAFQYLSD